MLYLKTCPKSVIPGTVKMVQASVYSLNTLILQIFCRRVITLFLEILLSPIQQYATAQQYIQKCSDCSLKHQNVHYSPSVLDRKFLLSTI